MSERVVSSILNQTAGKVYNLSTYRIDSVALVKSAQIRFASTKYHTAVVKKLGGLYEIRSSLRPLVSPGAILIRRTLLSLKAETESRTHKLKTRAVTVSAVTAPG